MLVKANLDLIISATTLYILTNVFRRFRLFHFMFYKLRFFLPSELSVYTRPTIDAKSILETKVASAFSKYFKLSLTEIDFTIQKLFLLSKLPVFNEAYNLIVVALATFITQLILSLYHGINADGKWSSWVIVFGLVTVLSSAKLTLYHLVDIRNDSFTIQFSLFLGILFAAFSWLFYFVPQLDIFQLTLTDELSQAAIHIRLLLNLVSSAPVQLSAHAITIILQCFITSIIGCIVTGITAACLFTTRVYHFQLWDSVFRSSFFRDDPTVSSTVKSALIFEHALLLLVGVVYCPTFEYHAFQLYSNFKNQNISVLTSRCAYDVLIPKSSCQNLEKSAISTEVSLFDFQECLLAIQLIVTFSFIFNRIYYIRYSLQASLNSAVIGCFSMIKRTDDQYVTSIAPSARLYLKDSVDKIGVLAGAHLTVPSLLLAGCAMLMRLSPASLTPGFLLAQSWTSLISETSMKISTNNITDTITSQQQIITNFIAYNTTQVIQDATHPPYLMDALHSLLFGMRLRSQSPSTKLFDFFKRVSELPLLPSNVATVLLKKCISGYSFLWLLLTFVCLYFWIMKSLFELLSLSSQQIPQDVSATSETVHVASDRGKDITS